GEDSRCLQIRKDLVKEPLGELALHVHLGPETPLDGRQDVPGAGLKLHFQRVLDGLTRLEELRGHAALLGEDRDFAPRYTCAHYNEEGPHRKHKGRCENRRGWGSGLRRELHSAAASELAPSPAPPDPYGRNRQRLTSTNRSRVPARELLAIRRSGYA